MNEISEKRNDLKNKSEVNLKEYLNQTYSIRKRIESDANKIIDQVKSNKENLLYEVSETENDIKKNFIKKIKKKDLS